MKNIFLLPAEENSPSRLHINAIGNFGLNPGFTPIKNPLVLYITSDEEIKEGDWGLSKLNEVILFGRSYPKTFYKKIILTTDQLLISDGVQGIDNTFIEWFIKNPTREFVHAYNDRVVGYEYDHYTIIIPIKCDCTHFCRKGTLDDELMYCDDSQEKSNIDDVFPVFDLSKNIFDKLSSLSEPVESHSYRYAGKEPKETPQIKCYDKYNQLLKEGDYVDVQKDGVHQIYKKDDNQLYFAPYGEEDRVSAYFSNDIAKCDKDGCWINNDRYEDIEEPKKYPIGGFAPGDYIGNCVTCKEQFLGAKRSTQCEPCAIEMVNVKVEVNDKGGIEIVKKDELEEAAEKAFPTDPGVPIDSLSKLELIKYLNNAKKKEGFIAGASWQSKRMYSEEEVLEHLNKLLLMPNSELDTFTDDNEMMTNKWFEKFKKK
jgi:hypothetical protein